VDGGGVVRTPYQVAQRLYAIAEMHWAEIDAHYLPVDLIRLPPHRFLNAVYAWVIARIDPQKVEEWLAQLQAPLPGAEKKKPTQAQIEAEGADFMATMQMVKQQRK
jgi:hypothetical protein